MLVSPHASNDDDVMGVTRTTTDFSLGRARWATAREDTMMGWAINLTDKTEDRILLDARPCMYHGRARSSEDVGAAARTAGWQAGWQAGGLSWAG